MNITDVEGIRHRLHTAHHQVGKLQTISTIYQQGKVVIIDEDLPLTAGQKTSLKTRFGEIKAGLVKMADKLEERTGLTGTIDPQIVQSVQEAPGRIFNAISGVIESSEVLEQAMKSSSSVDSDGNLVPVDLGVEAAQQTADTLATIRAAVKWWVQQEAAKLT